MLTQICDIASVFPGRSDLPAGGEAIATRSSLEGRPGCGIAPDKLNAIFEPFVQLDRTLKSPHQGTGLGLAISRDLAIQMNGTLTVESEVGKGCTFLLSLPAAQPH